MRSLVVVVSLTVLSICGQCDEPYKYDPQALTAETGYWWPEGRLDGNILTATTGERYELIPAGDGGLYYRQLPPKNVSPPDTRSSPTAKQGDSSSNGWTHNLHVIAMVALAVFWAISSIIQRRRLCKTAEVFLQQGMPREALNLIMKEESLCNLPAQVGLLGNQCTRCTIEDNLIRLRTIVGRIHSTCRTLGSTVDIEGICGTLSLLISVYENKSNFVFGTELPKNEPRKQVNIFLANLELQRAQLRKTCAQILNATSSMTTHG